MSQVKVGEYLFLRLKELGIKTVFGVPGDYELATLDLIEDVGLKFSGNPNELIASYAADGYSRLNGVGSFITTFGPGELSAYCGHAGAYTEFVPVAHIVGYPGRDAMKAHTIMHHTLGTGDFGVYHEMAKHISCSTVVLMDPATAPKEIDRCLQTMLYESRPCYIGIPVDMGHAVCDGSGLETKLGRDLPPNDPKAEEELVAELRKWLEKRSPIIIVDGNAMRSDVVAESQKLSDITSLPTFTTCMGKGALDEESPNYGGVYNGGGSHKAVKKAVESSDAVFWIGNFPSDFNTAEFTTNVAQDITVDFQRFFVKVGSKRHELKMKYVLRALIKSIEQSPLARTSTPQVNWDPYPLSNPDKGTELTQDYLWAALGKWFRPGEFAIGETGTSAFGIADSKLPSGAGLFNQTIFGSIGFATGAAVGAAKAIQERGHYQRCILVTGEGSFHLTLQALMDMLKLRLNPIVIILNNDGYTIERLIHGKEASYNQLPQLEYSSLARVFGPEHPSKYWGPVGTADELHAVLDDAEFNDGTLFRMLELRLGRFDAPASVRSAAEAVEAFNQKKGTQGANIGG